MAVLPYDMGVCVCCFLLQDLRDEEATAFGRSTLGTAYRAQQQLQPHGGAAGSGAGPSGSSSGPAPSLAAAAAERNAARDRALQALRAQRSAEAAEVRAAAARRRAESTAAAVAAASLRNDYGAYGSSEPLPPPPGLLGAACVGLGVAGAAAEGPDVGVVESAFNLLDRMRGVRPPGHNSSSAAGIAPSTVRAATVPAAAGWGGRSKSNGRAVAGTASGSSRIPGVPPRTAVVSSTSGSTMLGGGPVKPAVAVGGPSAQELLRTGGLRALVGGFKPPQPITAAQLVVPPAFASARPPPAPTAVAAIIGYGPLAAATSGVAAAAAAAKPLTPEKVARPAGDRAGPQDRETRAPPPHSATAAEAAALATKPASSPAADASATAARAAPEGAVGRVDFTADLPQRLPQAAGPPVAPGAATDFSFVGGIESGGAGRPRIKQEPDEVRNDRAGAASGNGGDQDGIQGAANGSQCHAGERSELPAGERQACATVPGTQEVELRASEPGATQLETAAGSVAPEGHTRQEPKLPPVVGRSNEQAEEAGQEMQQQHPSHHRPQHVQHVEDSHNHHQPHRDRPHNLARSPGAPGAAQLEDGEIPSNWHADAEAAAAAAAAARKALKAAAYEAVKPLLKPLYPTHMDKDRYKLVAAAATEALTAQAAAAGVDAVALPGAVAAAARAGGAGGVGGGERAGALAGGAAAAVEDALAGVGLGHLMHV